MQKKILCLILLIAIVLAVPRRDRNGNLMVMDTDASMEDSGNYTGDSELSGESNDGHPTESDTAQIKSGILTSAASQNVPTGENTFPQFQEQLEMTTETEPLEGHKVAAEIQEEMLESIPHIETLESGFENKDEASIQPVIHYQVTEGNSTVEPESGENESQAGAYMKVSEDGTTANRVDAFDENIGGRRTSEVPTDQIRTTEMLHQVVDNGSDAGTLGTEILQEPVEEPRSPTENLEGAETENLQDVSVVVDLQATGESTSHPDSGEKGTEVPKMEGEEATSETELFSTRADWTVTGSMTEVQIAETAEQDRIHETSMEARASTVVSEASGMTTSQSKISESLNEETVQMNSVESMIRTTDPGLQNGHSEVKIGGTTVQLQNDEASLDEIDSSVEVILPLKEVEFEDNRIYSSDHEIFQPDVAGREAEKSVTETRSIENTMEYTSESSIPAEEIVAPEVQTVGDVDNIRTPPSSPMFGYSDLGYVNYPAKAEVVGDENAETDVDAKTEEPTEQKANNNIAPAEKGTSQLDVAVAKVPVNMTVWTVNKHDLDENANLATDIGSSSNAGSPENFASFKMEEKQIPAWQNNGPASPHTTSGSSTLQFTFSMASALVISKIILHV